MILVPCGIIHTSALRLLAQRGLRTLRVALGPSALGWGKVSRILQIHAFVSFYTETTYQLITIGPRFYKNVIFFLFSRKDNTN